MLKMPKKIDGIISQLFIWASRDIRVPLLLKLIIVLFCIALLIFFDVSESLALIVCMLVGLSLIDRSFPFVFWIFFIIFCLICIGGITWLSGFKIK